MIVAAVKGIVNFLNQHKRQTVFSMADLSSIMQTEGRHLKVAENYISARIARQNDEVLKLVSNDVKLVSARDGTYEGKVNFREYLDKVKPTGSWKPATWNESLGKAEVLGTVRFLMINVGVLARFGFDTSGKIKEIHVGQRHKMEGSQVQ